MSVTFATDLAQVLGGYQVLTASTLPMPSTNAEDARRIVRHGLADVLDWLGEKVGPKPGEPTHCLEIGRCLFVSADMAAKIRRLNELIIPATTPLGGDS